jgi:hypothetical protein
MGGFFFSFLRCKVRSLALKTFGGNLAIRRELIEQGLRFIFSALILSLRFPLLGALIMILQKPWVHFTDSLISSFNR